MRKHLRAWIDDALLVSLSGRYEGVIAAVTEESLRNRYTAQRQIEPVITFDDGKRLCPNLTMRRALIEMFGPESNAWIGRRITVLRRRVESVNRETGETKERWQKSVCCEDPHARVVSMRREVADYDDSNEAIGAGGSGADVTAEEIFGKTR